MPGIADGVRAAQFFVGFLPSFTRLGYCARRPAWGGSDQRFDGQQWLVTGASTGIGREIAMQAARLGAHVIAIARSRERLDALAAACALAGGRLTPVALDLSLVASTDRLLDELLPALAAGPRGGSDPRAGAGVDPRAGAGSDPRAGAGSAGAGAISIDVLVNNVGIMLDAPAQTTEGLDRAFATNLLNPYLLTRGLVARGLARPDAVIINMSSGGMYTVPLEVAKLAALTPYDGALAYARHKRAQVALTARLARNAAQSDSASRYYVMHPGWVDTPGVETSMPAFHKLLRPLLRTPAEGADTALWLAARRPASAAEGIWFDRALRPAHVFASTRTGDSVDALLDYLDAHAEQARAQAGGAPATA